MSDTLRGSSADDYVVMPGERRAVVCGHELSLTAREFDVFARLAARPGWVLTPEQLCDDDALRYSSPYAVNVHVSHLRAKLAAAGAPGLIETVRGVGWRMRPESAPTVAAREAATAGRCIAAARSAAMHWEYADAIGQLDVALSHLDRAELDAPRLARTRAAVLERRGAARAALQDWPTARADYEAALALRPSEDHRVRARLFIRVAHASRLERERGGTEAALTRALGELEQVAERDRAWWQLRIEVRLQQADATCITDLPLWTPEVCSELAEVIELHGSSLQEAKYHLALADTELYAARWAVTDSCLAEARRAVECALRTDSIYLQSLTIAVLGSTLVFAGQYGEATVRLRQALGLAERCGDTIGVRAATMFLSIGARLSGDLRSTELHAAALRTLESEDASMPEFECSALGQLAWVALRRGEEDVARRLSEEAVGLWERDPSMSQSVWMMAWPATSCALADDDVARAFEYATLMTRPDQQVLAEGMEARLAEAVSHYSAGETEVAVEMINKLEIEARRLCYA